MRVTITGADDQVHTAELAELSAHYPGVEWGILYSRSRMGTPRYPSQAWLQQLYTRKARCPDMRLSLHVCGAAAREILAGDDRDLLGLATIFERAQLNGYSPPCPGLVARHATMLPGGELILQVRTVEAIPAAREDARAIGRASLLFDVSGGRGIAPVAWPQPAVDVPMGYAGGIGPENVAAVLGHLRDHCFLTEHDWIDMESGVRDAQNRFSLDRVRDVLRLVFGLPGVEPW